MHIITHSVVDLLRLYLFHLLKMFFFFFFFFYLVRLPLDFGFDMDLEVDAAVWRSDINPINA
jgi:hypothetical protein